MWQFMYGSDEMFADLEERTRDACLRFQDQEMPAGTVPARAAIGFEADPRSNRVCLLVERGLRYEGAVCEIDDWLRSGVKTFDDFTQLRSWLGSSLRDAFRSPTTADQEDLEVDASQRCAADHDLDSIESRGLRLARRLGCRMKDMPS